MTPGDDVLARFDEASALLAAAHDVVHGRPCGPAAPLWCEERGWASFLREFSDDAVLAAERDGLAVHLAGLSGAPDSLRTLGRDVTRVVDLPASLVASSDAVAPRRASPRKRAQVAAFAALLPGLLRRASRVVDIGSGHGHLTRHLASALGLRTEGWERDPHRVAVASSLCADERARFVTTDVRDAAGLLGTEDLVVGLHACGELGDLSVRACIAAGASLALVGCCLQKRAGDRVPLAGAASLRLGHAALGLGNVRDGDEGVEADLASRTASRVNRLALRAVLAREGHAMPPGGEMRGINRRRAGGSLGDLVASAFRARGLALPSPQVLAEAQREAHEAYAYQRRYELPRTMLARAVEVWVAWDRAARLAESGYASRVVLAFDARTSPRNIAVLAAPR